MNPIRPELHDNSQSMIPNSLSSSNAPDRVAVVRAMIEQEFLSLSRQQPRVFQLTLNEAEALAWQTGFAHLLFPILALEKARAVAEWHERQKSIRRAEPALSFAA